MVWDGGWLSMVGVRVVLVLVENFWFSWSLDGRCLLKNIRV